MRAERLNYCRGTLLLYCCHALCLSFSPSTIILSHSFTSTLSNPFPFHPCCFDLPLSLIISRSAEDKRWLDHKTLFQPLSLMSSQNKKKKKAYVFKRPKAGHNLHSQNLTKIKKVYNWSRCIWSFDSYCAALLLHKNYFELYKMWLCVLRDFHLHSLFFISTTIKKASKQFRVGKSRHTHLTHTQTL